MIGNFGDGAVDVYDPSTCALLGQLTDASGNLIVNTGLWELVFGTGTNDAGCDQCHVWFHHPYKHNRPDDSVGCSWIACYLLLRFIEVAGIKIDAVKRNGELIARRFFLNYVVLELENAN